VLRRAGLRPRMDWASAYAPGAGVGGCGLDPDGDLVDGGQGDTEAFRPAGPGTG
jgi:hypothetical protein